MEKLILIAGPCVVESEEITMHIAREVVRIASDYNLNLIFKASYRKANRTSGNSFSGIGDEQALEILAKVKTEFGVRVTTDIHTAEEARLAAEYVDVLQIPAFLCRQTDLLVAAGKTGKTVNIKKGQFASAGTMDYAVEKVRSSGNEHVMLTERGTFLGYNDLVVDMRNIPLMKKSGVPVIVDITHSLQQPNQPGGFSGGNPEMIETIGKCAVAAGADGIFLETHPDPAGALSDGLSMLPLNRLEDLYQEADSYQKGTIMKFIGIIPARYSSTRLPGKPLAIIGDKPMIQHVYERASQALPEVWVATDDERIMEAVRGFGGSAIMTSPDHKSGTDRCAEVAMAMAQEDDVIINIQGDMPFISPESINLLCSCFTDPLTDIATLAAPFSRAEDIHVKHKVKVLVEDDGWVYNFSRSPLKKDVPGQDKSEEWLIRNYKHIGIYGYRYKTLMQITKLPQSASELAESLEQLRWLANGYRIKCAIIADDTISVDTPDDLLNAVQFLTGGR